MDNKTVAYLDSLTLLACVGSWPIKSKDSKDIIRVVFRQYLNTYFHSTPSAFSVWFVVHKVTFQLFALQVLLTFQSVSFD